MAMAVVYPTFAGQIVSENRGGVTREYLSDPLGSTIALASSSAITDTWDYWPYGEVMTRTGTNPTPFTFVGTLGYFKDLLDKLLYVRARHYQPNYGRWLTVDPSWPRESGYTYGWAAPTMYADLLGLSPGSQFWRCYWSNIGRGVPGRAACQYCKTFSGSAINCDDPQFDVPGIPPDVIQWFRDFNANCGPRKESCFDCCLWLTVGNFGKVVFILGFFGLPNYVPTAGVSGCACTCEIDCIGAPGPDGTWEGGLAALRSILNCIGASAAQAAGGEAAKKMFPIIVRLGFG